MRRVETGIHNLDRLMGGGIPRRSMVLVQGEPGSGKTNLGLEFLYRGAEKGENGLFVSFQETENEILRTTTFEWDFEQQVKNGSINVAKFDPYRYGQVAEMLRSALMQNEAERVVMDPITDLDLYIDSRKEQRKNLLQIRDEIRDLDATCLLLAEEEESAELEEMVADGILQLEVERKEDELARNILVKKLKGSDFEHSVHRYRFEPDGLKVV